MTDNQNGGAAGAADPTKTAATNTGATNTNAVTTGADDPNKAAGGAGAAADPNKSAAAGTDATGGKAADKTILDGGGSDAKASTPVDWPADWRTKLAGDDKKLLATLERLGSPEDMAKKIREQDALIAQGKHKSALAKDATPEQIAAYRKENGIPDTVEKYDLSLPDGMVVGEDDKPIINNILTTMHGLNLNNDQVKAVIGAYYQQEKEFLASRAEQIAQDKTQQDDALHTEWGNDYRPNLNAISSLVKTFSEDTRNAMASALDSNCMPLLNNKAFLKDMAVLARTINPIDTVVSTGGGNQMSSVEDEIKAIEGRMGTDRDAYFKDAKAQARYLQLIEWRDKQKKVS